MCDLRAATFCLLVSISACQRAELPLQSAVEPLPTAYHDAAQAAARARVPEPSRGGPAIHPTASPLPPFLGVSRVTARYQGSPACASCHPAEVAVWQGSAHASARQTLLEQGKGFNPDCLTCHVTGLMHPGGFANLEDTPQLEHVGCESCHGPGSDHTTAPASGYGDLPKGPEACVACHTHDNSPDFRWEDYWPKIAHGG